MSTDRPPDSGEQPAPPGRTSPVPGDGAAPAPAAPAAPEAEQTIASGDDAQPAPTIETRRSPDADTPVTPDAGPERRPEADAWAVPESGAEGRALSPAVEAPAVEAPADATPAGDPPGRGVRTPLAVALGNASLCGLGYLMLGRRKAATVAGLVTLILLIILGSAARSLWFEIVVLVWWLAMIAHGWYLAGGWPGRRRTTVRRGSLIVGAAVLVAVLVALVLLRLHVASINRQVAAAVRTGDCPRATSALDRRWAGDYLADAPGAVRGADTGAVCEHLADVAATLDTAVTRSDPSGLPTALQDLSGLLAANPGEERMVTRTLDDFLARLPLRDPCDTTTAVDTLGAYHTRDALQGRAKAAVPRLAPAALVGCGDQNLRAKDWKTAKVSYQRLIKDYPKSPLVRRAFLGLVTANHAIELVEVRRVLGSGTTNTAYCSKPPAWGGAKAYRAASPNRVLLRGDLTYLRQLPRDWVVDDVANAVLVACASPKEQGDVVESCPYRSDSALLTSLDGTVTVSFHKIAIPIRVIEVQTGHVVADLRVQVGGASCPSVLSYTTYRIGLNLGPPRDTYVDAPDSAVDDAVRGALGTVINP